MYLLCLCGENSTSVIIKIPRAVYTEVLEYGRFRADGYVEVPGHTNGCNIHRHLPAVHIPVNGHCEGLQLLGLEIVITGGGEIPFGCEAETIIE
jgi:hypothetical protein